ncbi:peptidoglycan-binding protein [Enhydrobacter sp.]|uniref:peptidoglycan-binding protein n=1 Tax=Enhydrobacter sp. TaxID=1894999 RepID=UPI002637D958|nr:peptidoglycan-binding protein [Enhydrobacter sp.]WIM12865.1 MAG: hypothetical protein OJF58_003828 [Enhydrobacter sp.]
MTCARLLGIVLGAVSICCGGQTVGSEPLRLALVISNAQYKSLPPLATCEASATIVRDALRGKGIEVVERHDLGRGEFDTAIGSLARRAGSAPSTFVTLYYCGYAVEFNGRSFLLPTSASLAREYDVLTQGIISKSLLDSLMRAKDSGGLLLLDVFRTSSAASSGLARLVDQATPSSYAVIGASNDAVPGGPTPASLALREEASELGPDVEPFTTGMRHRLAKNASVTTHFSLATARPAAPSSSTVPATPSSSSTAIAPPPPTPPAAPTFAAPQAAPMPARQIMADEEGMSEQDRRLVQVKLATLGYYIGRIDANFGPETRAAIRRYQFEIKAEMTGHLTAEQATRLVNSVR